MVNQNWKKTEYRGIHRREGRFRVQPFGEYLGIREDMRSALDLLEEHGHEIERDRTKREDPSAYVEKLNIYLDWVVDSKYEPGDWTCMKEYRKAAAYLVRASPCSYHIAIEGKEEPWCRAVKQAYDKLSAADKLALLMLTSDVESEFKIASKIQHRIYSDALTTLSSPSFRRERKWWVQETEFNVTRHMGWLNKAVGIGILKKVDGNGLALGEMGYTYALQPWSRCIGLKYKHKARLTTMLASLPAPRSFPDYLANRNSMLALPNKYHDLWYFRTFNEVERMLSVGTLDLPLRGLVSLERFVEVFPDEVGHLQALGKHFNCEDVASVMKKTGYSKRGLPASQLTMHLCFAGMLHTIDVKDMRKVQKKHLKSATAAHKKRHYHGHPVRVFRDACRALP